MKYFSIIATIVVLTACNQLKKQNNDAKPNAGLTIPLVTDNKNIFGQWTMCSTFDNGMMTSANQCPTVTFTMHGTGFVTFPSGELENFTWTLKNSILTISHAIKSADNTFSDTSYAASIEKGKDWLELLIRDIPNGVNYYLSKQLANINLDSK